LSSGTNAKVERRPSTRSRGLSFVTLDADRWCDLLDEVEGLVRGTPVASLLEHRCNPEKVGQEVTVIEN